MSIKPLTDLTTIPQLFQAIVDILNATKQARKSIPLGALINISLKTCLAKVDNDGNLIRGILVLYGDEDKDGMVGERGINGTKGTRPFFSIEYLECVREKSTKTYDYSASDDLSSLFWLTLWLFHVLPEITSTVSKPTDDAQSQMSTWSNEIFDSAKMNKCGVLYFPMEEYFKGRLLFKLNPVYLPFLNTFQRLVREIKSIVVVREEISEWIKELERELEKIRAVKGKVERSEE